MPAHPRERTLRVRQDDAQSLRRRASLRFVKPHIVDNRRPCWCDPLVYFAPYEDEPERRGAVICHANPCYDGTKHAWADASGYPPV